MNIVITTERAVKNLTHHRDRHIEEYKEQFKGWKEAMQSHGDELKDWAANRSDEKQPPAPPRPNNYLRQYNELLDKLDYHVLDTIELDEYEFKKIIHDQFNWTRDWLFNNATYAGTSIPASRQAVQLNEGGFASLSASHISGGTLSADHIDVGIIDA